MPVELNAIYKGIKDIPAGKFTNEKGQLIEYKQSFKLRFEIMSNGLPDIFSIKVNQEVAMNIASNYKIGDNVKIFLEIRFKSNGSFNLYYKSIEKIK